jgi:hypothetical protein
MAGFFVWRTIRIQMHNRVLPYRLATVRNEDIDGARRFKVDASRFGDFRDT